MPRRVILAWAFVALLSTSSAQAQTKYAKDLIPTRTALGRLGLERSWLTAVPLESTEKLLLISFSGDMVFAQTSHANFHAYEAESGRLLWSANLGKVSARPRPASINSKSVFVTNMNRLYHLDRKTGRAIWTKELDTLPSSATTCDDERVMVGLDNSKVYAYGLTMLDEERKPILDRAVEEWNWQTNGIVHTRPVLSAKLAFFGSDDGKIYVSLSQERTMLYRIGTEGAIGSGFGTLGTRLLLVPSADRKLYGLDIFTAKMEWAFASGAPILQEPLVADDDIFVVNASGDLSSVDSKTGSPKWTTSTLGGRLVAVGAKRIYLESHNDDLLIVDRETGKMIADAKETRQRSGLNLRPFELVITNPINDRIYLGTNSGVIVAIREQGEVSPRPLKNPADKPFGFIPLEGIVDKPTATLLPTDEPAADAKPAEDKPAEEMPAEEPK